MKKQIKIGVIFGGRSGEHEVSLASARSIIQVLSKEKYQVTQIGITKDGIWLSSDIQSKTSVLESFNKHQYDGLTEVILFPSSNYTGSLYKKSITDTDGLHFELLTTMDVVFPVLHGTYGEDGTMQGFFELNDIAYVGAGVVGSAVGMDKAIFKHLMYANSLPIVEWLLCNKYQIEENIDSTVDMIISKLPFFPLFVKPANLGSSVGISKCHHREELKKGLLVAAQYDRRIIVEKGIDAREIEISILGNEKPMISQPGEIIPSREFYSYEAKYIDNRSELIIPAPLPESVKEQVKTLALKCYQICDCAGMARVDFLLDKHTQQLYISEINTIPGFTSISMYPKLWEKSGIEYSTLVDELIKYAFMRKEAKKSLKFWHDG